MDQVLGWRQAHALGRVSLTQALRHQSSGARSNRGVVQIVRAESGDDSQWRKSKKGKGFEHEKRRKGRPAHMRSPDDSPLRDGNRDRLIGLLTERAVHTLMRYLSETNASTYVWLTQYYEKNKIPRNGSWDDVSGETFLRTLLCKPIEEANSNMGRESLFNNIMATAVDPRSIAQRIMDIRVQLAQEFVQDLTGIKQENNALYSETLQASLTMNFNKTTEAEPTAADANSSTATAAAITNQQSAPPSVQGHVPPLPEDTHPEVKESITTLLAAGFTRATSEELDSLLKVVFPNGYPSDAPPHTTQPPPASSSTATTPSSVVPDTLPSGLWPTDSSAAAGADKVVNKWGPPVKKIPKAPTHHNGPAWLIDPDSALNRTGFESHGVSQDSSLAGTEEPEVPPVSHEPIVSETPVVEETVKEEDLAASTSWFAALQEMAGDATGRSGPVERPQVGSAAAPQGPQGTGADSVVSGSSQPDELVAVWESRLVQGATPPGAAEIAALVVESFALDEAAIQEEEVEADLALGSKSTEEAVDAVVGSAVSRTIWNEVQSELLQEVQVALEEADEQPEAVDQAFVAADGGAEPLEAEVQAAAEDDVELPELLAQLVDLSVEQPELVQVVEEVTELIESGLEGLEPIVAEDEAVQTGQASFDISESSADVAVLLDQSRAADLPIALPVTSAESPQSRLVFIPIPSWEKVAETEQEPSASPVTGVVVDGSVPLEQLAAAAAPSSPSDAFVDRFVEYPTVMSLSAEEIAALDDDVASEMWRAALREMVAANLMGPLNGTLGRLGGESQDIVINQIGGTRVLRFGKGSGKVTAGVVEGVQGKDGAVRGSEEEGDSQQEGQDGSRAV